MDGWRINNKTFPHNREKKQNKMTTYQKENKNI